MRFAVAAALLALAGVDARAQQVHSPPQERAQTVPDSTTIAAAERFLNTVETESAFLAVMDEMIDALSAGMAVQFERDAGEPFPPALLAEIKTVLSAQIDRIYRANSNDIQRETAIVHARHFTAAELNHLTMLMNDPVMRKYNGSVARMMPELSAIWEKVIGRRYDQEVEEAIVDTVVDYFERNGKTPPPIS